MNDPPTDMDPCEFGSEKDGYAVAFFLKILPKGISPEIMQMMHCKCVSVSENPCESGRYPYKSAGIGSNMFCECSVNSNYRKKCTEKTVLE